MSLFQPSVLKKYLSQQDSALVQKAYKKYTKYFHNASIQENIRNSKEEQFQEGFLRELFVDILGYTLNPTPKFNLTTELKNIKGSKKVDGAILKDGNALAVIELKGTNTKDMESIRQQAFDYKANQTGCIYVITSNFEKLRFYINNAVDYEEFNLFSLTHAEFEIFYLCLAKENILANRPLSIKEASVVEEENITKKFYADYSIFKRELYRDLVKQNRNNIILTDLPEKTSKLILFKKSQKLIDRFLFILFAEDRGLLAPNSINTILKEWKALADLDVEVPLYDRYKQYFGYLDTGRKGTDKKEEIFAYNGGLFQLDAILNAVIIDNEMLYRHTKKLSTYDFESQVDVNILGHIFEHSLNEIESVNAEIEGTDFDKQKTKRKKDGVFYTPKYITKYIVDNTIGKLCSGKKGELGIIDEEYAKGRKNRQATTIIKLDQQLKDYREWLLELTICDPACGSGAFLNQALDFLIREHAYIDELTKQLFGGGFAFPDIENQILEHNIYGVDLNEESIEIAKLSLWLRTAQPKRKLTSLNNNIKCGNSLIESKAIAGDKAFNWKEQFPEVFANGGFDVIIGNPPYVTSKEDMFSKETKSFFISNYKTSAYQIDLYILFLEKSMKLISEKGVTSLIVPNSWLNNLFLETVRKYFLTRTFINEIVSMPSNTFVDANVDTVIVTLNNLRKDSLTKLVNCTNGEFDIIGEINQRDWLEEKGSMINVHITNDIRNIFEKVNQDSIALSDLADIGRGVGVYHKRVGHTKEIIERDPYQSSYKEDNTFLPYLRGRNVQTGHINWDNDSYISYGKWLAEPREPKFFTGERIVLRQIPSSRLIVSYLDEDFVIDQSVFIARFYNDSRFKPKSILSILGSKLLSFYFRFYYSEFDDLFPKVKLQHFKSFPISRNLLKVDLELESKTELFLKSNKDFKILNNKFSNYFSGQFNIEKLTKKLENWQELLFADFIKEISKAIKTSGGIQLTKKDEIEWMDLFEDYKKQAQTLKQEIDKTDKEIDKIVYELYGLSEEEIEIIENS